MHQAIIATDGLSEDVGCTPAVNSSLPCDGQPTRVFDEVPSQSPFRVGVTAHQGLFVAPVSSEQFSAV